MISTISIILRVSLGAIIFSHDMLLNIPLIPELQTITCNRGVLVNNIFLKSYQQCINYDHFVGQQVLKYDNTIKGKLAVKTSSPFMMVHIHVNGIITI